MLSPDAAKTAARGSSRPQFDFSGHRAVVTGAARGIGCAIADALGAAGAEVHVFDVGAPQDPAGFRHGFASVDIADAEAVQAAVAALPGAVTLLVNNAGITRDRSIAPNRCSPGRPGGFRPG